MLAQAHEGIVRAMTSERLLFLQMIGASVIAASSHCSRLRRRWVASQPDRSLLAHHLLSTKSRLNTPRDI
jgi:hypothetical protein